MIDLRSDTVTRPTRAMREAMLAAPLGDDVLGDDPTVRALEERVAALLGKEAACFVPSGTMANQVAIRALTEPGDEIITHEGSHIIHYEGGAPAVISGCMIRALPGPRGMLTPEAVVGAVRHDDAHYPRSRLLVLENTHNRGGGAVWPMEAMAGVASAARERGLSVHIDGARLWNACAATGHAPAEYARHADTVSCCFSKGLGAPVGSAVAGSRVTIAKARRVRKMLGGGMRQSGILASACLHAMEHHRERLREDHAHARAFAEVVARSPWIRLAPEHEGGVATNIVYFDLVGSGTDGSKGRVRAADLSRMLAERGVLMFDTGPWRIRAVTHLDVTGEMVARAAEAVVAAANELAARA